MLCNGYDYDDLVEYETVIDGMHVRIAKVGGGTLGEAYDGRWAYSADDDDWRDDLHTGMPKTHAEAAIIVHEFLSEEEI
jgi:hypothetical protein